MQDLVQKYFGNTVNPIAAYIIIFLIIVIAIYILVRIARRLLGGTFVAGGKSRHLRLAVMDATPVDSHRRLVLVRRDDVEHLILIGGPTDVVVEQNIRLAAPPAARTEPAAMAAPAPVSNPAPVEAVVAPAPIPPIPPIPPMAASPTIRPYAPPPVPPRPVQPAPPAPARPMAPIAPMTPRIEPRPLAPRPVDPRPMVSPSLSNEPNLTPDLRNAAVPTVAAATVIATAPVVAAVQAPAKSMSLEDSLLVDLSNDIDNATKSEADDISLEDEMEGLLASLDTKSDRIG